MPRAVRHDPVMRRGAAHGRAIPGLAKVIGGFQACTGLPSVSHGDDPPRPARYRALVHTNLQQASPSDCLKDFRSTRHDRSAPVRDRHPAGLAGRHPRLPHRVRRRPGRPARLGTCRPPCRPPNRGGCWAPAARWL
jgi:hypothetical protein